MRFHYFGLLLPILMKCPSVFAADTNTPKNTKYAKTDISSDVATSRHQVTVPGSRKKVSDSGGVGGSDNNEDDGDEDDGGENDGNEDDKLVDLILNQVENNLDDYYDGNEETFCEDVDGDKDYEAISINLDNNTTHYAQDDDFRKEYDEVSKMNEDDYADSPMMKILINDIKFANNLERDINTNPRNYTSTAAQKKLVQDCNAQRFIVGTAFEEHLPPDLPVNMANPHSEKATTGFHAHYCPPKVRPVVGVPFDSCNEIQSCMHTLLSKIPNYLANEHSGNVDMSLASFGGRDADFNKDKMVVNDLITACIPKTDTDAEMVEQYIKIQNHLKLKKMLHLLMFSYNTQRRHLLIAQVCHPDPNKKFQLHITSSATEKYIMGNGAGVEKYLKTYVSKHFEITVGVHPQVFLLGANKSDSHYPPAVKKIMGRTLVEVYRDVLDLREGFEDKTEIMFKFGGDFKSVDAGAYNYLASRLEEEDLLDLCKHVHDSLNADNTEDSKVKSAGAKVADVVAEEKAAVETYLTRRRWPKADITLFTEQLDEAVTFELVIDRLKRFTAGHQMHTIAAQMTDEMFDNDGVIPDHINSMIETLESTLRKTRNRIMSSLRRIKTSQGGLVLFSQLVSRFSRAGGRDKGRIAIQGNDLDRLVERSLGSRDVVVAKIEKEAMKCDETFWRRYRELKANKDQHTITFEDKKTRRTHTILFVYPQDDEGRNSLYTWFAEQVNYPGLNDTNNTDLYPVKAYERVGSLEYQALVELGVSFDDELNKSAHRSIRSEGHKKKSGGKKDSIDPSLNDTTLGDDTTLGEEPEIDTSIRFD